jgi:hypothetical protein
LSRLIPNIFSFLRFYRQTLIKFYRKLTKTCAWLYACHRGIRAMSTFRCTQPFLNLPPFSGLNLGQRKRWR